MRMKINIVLLSAMATFAPLALTLVTAEDYVGQPDRTVKGVASERGGKFKSVDLQVADGPFKPDFDSLSKTYQCPEWFRDSKFGVWICWNAYTVAGTGDWYARQMYIPGTSEYNYHVKTFGHPSKFGYKDIVQKWKGEKFDADQLISLFKDAGAKYCVVMANHHDNFDLWNSKYHHWNSVEMGPKKDIVGQFRDAVLKHGLRFGVTTHLERTSSWFQVNKGSDKTGPLAGVPYDGNDPAFADFYLPPNPDGDNNDAHPRNAPEYWRQHWLARQVDLIDTYKPDLNYVDGGVPFYGDDQGKTGLEMIAHLYNRSAQWHNGKNEAVMCIKDWHNNGLWGYYREGIATLDLEMSNMSGIGKLPWQTDTNTGGWSWSRNASYRPASNIIHELADNVSKNGNVLLSVPLREDGSLEPQVVKILQEVGEWIKVNGDGIFATRPWTLYGEPQKSVKGGIRFTQSKDGKTLNAIALGWPTDNKIVIRSLAKPNVVKSVKLLGCKESLTWKQTEDGLEINLPSEKISDIAITFVIEGEKLQAVPISNMIRPASDGTVTLKPSSAELHGGIQVEQRGDQENIGFWNNGKDYLSWTVAFPAPGTYRVKTSYSSESASRLTLEANTKKFSVSLKATQGWDDFQPVEFGFVRLKKAGKLEIAVRPDDSKTWKPVNLRSVILEPVKEESNPMDAETSWEHAPTDYKPPEGLVKGGSFIDRILPMPVGPNGLRSDVWGGDNVKPRNVENGIEDPKWSFWCMSVHKNPTDGKEHLFGVRWPESAPAGHMNWFHSRVYHAVSDSPTGPFKVVEEDIGAGHNVMCYRAKDGTYVLYVNGGAYTSSSVNGPWKPSQLKYDTRGTDSGEMTNHTFTSREDGSVLMVSRGGRTWISEDGLKPFRKITLESAYPKIKGNFEDPVVWRDEVQYNLIVNDWFGRTAYYLRSKDGVEWVWDQGIAYDVNIAKHPDGTREKWYKFERPNVRQDEFGRATHMYFAVLDSRKDLDKGSDNHSSKVIALPLIVQKRLEILDKEPIAEATKEIRVLIKAEAGFNPQEDLDIGSLRFGAPQAVDFGKGSKVVKSSPQGKDLVVTFSAAELGFTKSDFVGKLLGSNPKKEIVFGYARLPGVSFTTPLVSAPPPNFAADGLHLRVENFGVVASIPGKVVVTTVGNDGVKRASETSVPVIPPYQSADVVVPIDYAAIRGNQPASVKITIACGGSESSMNASFSELSPGPDGQTRLKLKEATTDVCGWGNSRENVDVSKKELKVGGQTFKHGIGTHAPSRQEWLLDGSFDNLSLRTGVVSNQRGSITVEVWADGKRLYASPVLKGGEEPITISLPMKGVRQLTLTTTDGDNGNSGDHVVYGEPILKKADPKNQ